MTPTGPAPSDRLVGHVESEGEQIYYELIGSGPLLVMCHGGGENHAMWWQQLAAFADRFQLLIWDQRGHGNSTARTGEIGPAPARRDLRAIIERLRLPRATVVGHSLGGFVALGFAVAHPELVEALVLSTTLAGAERHHLDTLRDARVGRTRSGHRDNPLLSAGFSAAHPDLAILYDQLRGWGTLPDPGAVLAAMSADEIPRSGIRDLRRRALVVAASDDRFCPAAAMRSVATALPHSRMVTVPGGHSAYYERPTEWNRAVLDFVVQARATDPPPGPGPADPEEEVPS